MDFYSYDTDKSGKIYELLIDYIESMDKTIIIDKTDLYNQFNTYLQVNHNIHELTLPLFSKYYNKIVGKRSSNVLLTDEDKLLLDFVKKDYGYSVSDSLDMLKSDIKKVSQGFKVELMKKSLIVSGIKGMGKTTSVVDILKKENINYGSTKGSQINGVNDFYKLLYSNNYITVEGKLNPKGKEVIVFDDCPDLLKKSSRFVPMLLSALDNKKYRTLSCFDKRDPDIASKKYPQSFQFCSTLIFITNLPYSKMNDAIIDRSYTQIINYSPDEIFIAIENNFDKYHLDISIDTKKEVLLFLRKFEPHFKHKISFRDYEAVLGEATVNTHWKELSLKKLLK